MVATTETALPDLSARSVLVLDDDTSIVRALERVFRALGARVRGVGTLREARLALDDDVPDAVLADFRLREGTGLELLPEYLARRGDGAFCLITGHGSIDHAVEALRSGARHYFEKPLEPIALARKVMTDLEGPGSDEPLATRLAPWLAFADPATARALADVPALAGGDEPVVIQGENGTGRSLVARALHGLASRAHGPFVAIDAGDARSGSDPFGQDPDGRAGTVRRGATAVERAEGGTLLVREPAKLPAAEQAALLHLLDRGSVRRSGDGRACTADVRVVAVVRHPLDVSVADGALREDLANRLDVLRVHMPPLRDRPLDVAPLAARAFVRAWMARGRSGLAPSLDAGALDRLAAPGWPGNVRELGNVMRRLAALLPDGVREIDAAWLDAALGTDAPGPAPGLVMPRGTTLAVAERLLIDEALREANYNRALAARTLGIGERTLRRKLNRR